MPTPRNWSTFFFYIIFRMFNMQPDLICHGYSKLHDPPHVAIEHIDNHRRNGHQQQVQRYSGVPRTSLQLERRRKKRHLGLLLLGFSLNTSSRRTSVRNQLLATCTTIGYCSQDLLLDWRWECNGLPYHR
jgi:hypothetical protein